MKSKKRNAPRKQSGRDRAAGLPSASSTATFDAAMISGAVAGATVGAVAGPPGIVAGSIVGAAAGILAGAALEVERKQAEEDTDRLDRAIGVTEGSLGTDQVAHPPARIGAFSGASAGAAASTGTASEGPMQNLDEG